MHRDELRVAGHFAGEEDNGNEDEQRTEHIHVIRDERQVIIKNDFAQRYLILKEIVHLLREVKYDGDRQNEHDGKEERAQKLANYVPVKTFHVGL